VAPIHNMGVEEAILRSRRDDLCQNTLRIWRNDRSVIVRCDEEEALPDWIVLTGYGRESQQYSCKSGSSILSCQKLLRNSGLQGLQFAIIVL
jgi:hypothetical protein